MAYFANVIIDISHEKLDRTFQYAIPESMAGELTEGMRVEIPFGRSDRIRKGYVIGITEKAEYPVEKIKPIRRILPKEAHIEGQLIALAAWMRKNYGGTMNQALKTVIPVKQEVGRIKKRRVALGIEKEAARELLAELKRKHHTARARLVGQLIDADFVSYEMITGKLGVSGSVVKALEEKGIVRIDTEDAWRNPISHIQAQKQPPKALSPAQKQIVDSFAAEYADGRRRTYLIHGVTGSGKTEVYMGMIEKTLEYGRQAIVLIPEIALTFQTVMRFYQRFGDRVSILNSRMSQGERYDQFQRARLGEVSIIIGPRSALFTPFPDLGLIIIDEEHESSYKSENVPRYHARETAGERARLCGASVVLGSATPSLESYYRAKKGQYRLFELNERIGKSSLPRVMVVDMRAELKQGNRSMFSKALIQGMQQCLEKKEQAMLFLNRRGIAGFVSCRSCGNVLKCPHCDVSLSQHSGGRLICHYCGFEMPLPSKCPQCGSVYIGGFRAGTEKIEQEVGSLFPGVRVLRMDADTTKKKSGYEDILSAFANEEADILIGTQMIVKGHDFPKVTLVGVIAADMSLAISDFHASERTFQLLVQASGRAGRAQRPGNVVVQTYQPEHYAIQSACRQDYKEFYEREIAFRSLMGYPPVANLLLIIVSSEDENAAGQAVKAFFNAVSEYCDEGFRIIGPADAPIAKIQDIYKKILYIKHERYEELVNIKEWLEQEQKNIPIPRKVMVQYDFNPVRV